MLLFFFLLLFLFNVLHHVGFYALCFFLDLLNFFWLFNDLFGSFLLVMLFLLIMWFFNRRGWWFGSINWWWWSLRFIFFEWLFNALQNIWFNCNVWWWAESRSPSCFHPIQILSCNNKLIRSLISSCWLVITFYVHALCDP